MNAKGARALRAALKRVDAKRAAEGPACAELREREPFLGPRRPGRNVLCPCGSRRKYKTCCRPAVARNRGPVASEAFRAAATACGSCGGAHPELIFFPFPAGSKLPATHHALCPITGRPLTLNVPAKAVPAKAVKPA